MVRLECGTDLEHKVINWDNLTRVVSCLGASSKMGDNFKTLEMILCELFDTEEPMMIHSLYTLVQSPLQEADPVTKNYLLVC